MHPIHWPILAWPIPTLQFVAFSPLNLLPFHSLLPFVWQSVHWSLPIPFLLPPAMPSIQPSHLRAPYSFQTMHHCVHWHRPIFAAMHPFVHLIFYFFPFPPSILPALHPLFSSNYPILWPMHHFVLSML